jgi:hypothetical protein
VNTEEEFEMLAEKSPQGGVYPSAKGVKLCPTLTRPFGKTTYPEIPVELAAFLLYDKSRKGSDAMTALNGYYDGKNIIPLGHTNMLRKNQKVVITVLDDHPESGEEGLQLLLNLIDETAGMLNDLNDEELSKFDHAVSERVNIFRTVDF